MQTLNVESIGMQYLQACLSYYTEQGSYYILYLAAILFLVIKGTKLERRMFIPGAILLLLSVYNPVFPVVLNHFFDVNKEYYRFFWIAPVIVVVPYVCTKILFMLTDQTKRYLALGIFVIVFCVSGKFIYSNGYVRAENEYKISNDLIQISEIIHRDSEHDYPRVLMEYHYNMEMRQYDPKILLTIDREDYIYAMSAPYTDEMLEDETKPQYKLLAKLIHYQDISDEAFKDALDATNTEYIVVSGGNANVPYLGANGYRLVAQTENHMIFHYDLKERKEFELIDYSGLRGEN